MTPPRRFNGNVSFWSLGLLLVLPLSAASAPSPLYRVYQELWQFPALTLTAIYASYAVGGVAGLLLTGRLPDHLGRRLVLTVGLTVATAAMLTLVLMSVYLSFSVPTVLAGAFVSVIGLVPTTYAYGAIVAVLAGVTTAVVSRRIRGLEARGTTGPA